jgi:hypothetical protein
LGRRTDFTSRWALELKRFLGFLTRYFGWLLLAFVSTIGGVFLAMLFADWSLQSLLASGLAWPLMALASIVAVPIALIGLGRIYFFSALGGGFLFNLVVVLL